MTMPERFPVRVTLALIERKQCHPSSSRIRTLEEDILFGILVGDVLVKPTIDRG